MNRMTPKELTSDEISVLFRNKSKDGTYKPLGLFYHRNGTTVTGIDNSSGEAWTEDFPSTEECFAWLKQEDDGQLEK